MRIGLEFQLEGLIRIANVVGREIMKLAFRIGLCFLAAAWLNAGVITITTPGGEEEYYFTNTPLKIA